MRVFIAGSSDYNPICRRLEEVFSARNLPVEDLFVDSQRQRSYDKGRLPGVDSIVPRSVAPGWDSPGQAL
jgi:hypothetical protein